MNRSSLGAFVGDREVGAGSVCLKGEGWVVKAQQIDRNKGRRYVLPIGSDWRWILLRVSRFLDRCGSWPLSLGTWTVGRHEMLGLGSKIAC